MLQWFYRVFHQFGGVPSEWTRCFAFLVGFWGDELGVSAARTASCCGVLGFAANVGEPSDHGWVLLSDLRFEGNE